MRSCETAALMAEALPSVRADGSVRPAVRVRPGWEEEPEVAPRPARDRGELVQWRHGFGFIRPDSLGPNVFLHSSQLVREGDNGREPRKGDVVEYERRPPDAGEKADRAINARLVDELPPPFTSSLAAAAKDAPAAASSSAAAPAAPPAAAPASAGSRRSASTLVPRSVAARGRDAPRAAGASKRKRERPPEAGVLGLS